MESKVSRPDRKANQRLSGIYTTAVLVALAIFTVDEREKAIKLQLGEVRRADYEPGLHFKTPFVQEVRRFDKRILSWDGDPNQIPTKGAQLL